MDEILISEIVIRVFWDGKKLYFTKDADKKKHFICKCSSAEGTEQAIKIFEKEILIKLKKP